MPAAIPIIAVASVAMAASGTVMQMNAASRAADAQKQQIANEQKIEAERKKQMELEARRKQLEIIRQQQRARSMALASANAQGGLFGSGLQGGYGQISGVSNVNAMGVQQNLEIGQNIFGFNAGVSNAKIAYADAQSYDAMGKGISSLGGIMMKALPTASSFFGPGGSSGGGGNSLGTIGGFSSSAGNGYGW
jgi:hypothetical protein